MTGEENKRISEMTDLEKLANRIEKALTPFPICRDCGDFGPRCPNSGELCEPIESAKELSDMIRELNVFDI